MEKTGETRLYVFRITGNEGAIHEYLCDYHAPVVGGRYKDDDNDGQIVEVTKRRPATDYERENFGADECDCCIGACLIGGPTEVLP